MSTNNKVTGTSKRLADLMAEQEEPEARRSAADCSAGWLPIETAPKDGTEIIVYCPPAHGLNHMATVCAWHEDAGFCVDELREPTLWIPLPNDQGLATQPAPQMPEKHK